MRLSLSSQKAGPKVKAARTRAGVTLATVGRRLMATAQRCSRYFIGKAVAPTSERRKSWAALRALQRLLAGGRIG
jgi:hypothetical protein